MDKHNKNKLHKYSKNIISIFPIIISIIALIFSGYSYYNLKIENRPNIKLVQNLWNNNPSFSLLNEGTAKLDQVPYPTYFIYVPSKVYWYVEDETYSNLILSPVSYDAIEEQTNGNEGTKSTISKSTLPKVFKSKFGERDTINSKIIKLDSKINLRIETLPFLMIISPIKYHYRGEMKKKILLNTSNLSKNITKEDYKNIKDYTRDNTDLEVDYKKAEKKVKVFT
ncbi:hypothetical protein WL241_11550 [Staphylococcus epidermidis]|uniref:hypothetical protein n=1 Tax=Staphylococcus epidermidis TaxID=1282 RepID=UPI00138AD405